MITAIIAMESEAEILLKNATVTAEKTLLGKKTYEGEFHGKKFALVICGVGKVNAAVGAAAGITAYRPSSVLNFGVAGGLNESAKLCEIYAINKAVQFDFDLTQLNGGKIGTLDEYDSPYLPVLAKSAFPLATLATGDRFNDSTQDLALLNDELYADIRDMEGAAIAQVALSAKVPLYMYKAISDVVGGDCVQQYRDNLARALGALTAAVPQIFNEVK